MPTDARRPSTDLGEAAGEAGWVGASPYLRILSAAYMKVGDDRAPPKPGLALGTAIGLCLAAGIGLGLWPSPLVEHAAQAASALVGSGAHASR